MQPGGKTPYVCGVVVQRQADLFEVIAALRAAGRFPRGLHRRQQQCDAECR